ncbi:MAG: glycosyltransferase family 2 protein, partial [Clostridia bacterium]|nr:glycosyltransferase family 2 protein [Clostridia bacterium]
REVRGEIVLLVDGDLGPAVGAFGPLLTAGREGRADMAVARLRPPEGRGGRGRGGFGLALGLARWGVRHLGGVAMEAPLSGQRAIRREVLAQVDLEGGFGLEVGLDIDLARLGARILEVPIAVDAAHAVTGRTLGGFLHRGRQFLAVARALWRRRRR